MRVADNPGDAGKSSELFGGALGVAAGDNDACGGVGGVKLSNGVAGLGVGGGRDRAGVHDDDVSGGGLGCGGATAIEQLALDGGAIGLRGATAELLDIEGRHRFKIYKNKNSTQRSQSPHREHRAEEAGPDQQLTSFASRP